MADDLTYLSSNPPNPRSHFRHGDWLCPRTHCNAHNFGRNLNCIGCGCPRSVSLPPTPMNDHIFYESSPLPQPPQPPQQRSHQSLPPKPSHPLLTPSGRSFAIGGRVQNISSDPLAPCIMYWPDNEPFPEQSQIRPSNVAGVAPPILNTGNRGPISHQPGDWVCGKCNYLNWRRRKVCQTCLPYAEGNGDSISAAVQAERIALLTQVLSQASHGVTPSPTSSSLLQPPPNSAPALVTSMPIGGGGGHREMQNMGIMRSGGTGSLTPPQIRTRSSTTHLALGSHHAPSPAQGQLYSSSSSTSQHPHHPGTLGLGPPPQHLSSSHVSAAGHHGHHGGFTAPLLSRDALNATASGPPHGFQGNRDAQTQGLMPGNNSNIMGLGGMQALRDGMGAIPSVAHGGGQQGGVVQGRVHRSQSHVSLRGGPQALGAQERGSSPMIYQTGSSAASTPLTQNVNLPSLHPTGHGGMGTTRTGRATTLSLGHIQQLANLQHQQQQAFPNPQQQQGLMGSMHAPQSHQPPSLHPFPSHDRPHHQPPGLASSIHAPHAPSSTPSSSVPHPSAHRIEHHRQTVPQTIVESELYSTGPVPGAFSHPPSASSAASSTHGGDSSRRGSASSAQGPPLRVSPAPPGGRGRAAIAGSEGLQRLRQEERDDGRRDGRGGDQRRGGGDLRSGQGSFPVLDDRESTLYSSQPTTANPNRVHAPAPLLPSFLQDMVAQDTAYAIQSPPSLSPASASASETSSEPHEAESASEEGHSEELPSTATAQHPVDLERRQSTARVVPSRPRVSSGSTDEESNKPGVERSIWRVGIEEDVSLSRKTPPEQQQQQLRSVTGTFTPTTPSPFANITPIATAYLASPNSFGAGNNAFGGSAERLMGVLPRSGSSSVASSPSPYATPFAATPTAAFGVGEHHGGKGAVGIIGMGRVR